MRRIDGTLPSTLRLEACDEDPRVLAVVMSTSEGARALDTAVGLTHQRSSRPLASEKRLGVCEDDPRVLAALMATPEGAKAVDEAAGLI